MPILPALFNDNIPKKFRFPSLRYFSFRFGSNSRRPFTSIKTSSMNNLHPSKQDSSSGPEMDDYMELKGGTVSVRPNEPVLMGRVH